MKIQNKAAHIENCLIVGLGKTGLSCARFLLAQGMDVVVMDTRDNPPCLPELQQSWPQVVVRTGQLDQDWLLRADKVLLSPGVDPRLPEIVAAKEAGVDVIGDIELFARHVNAPVIAVTGSNGKSTVTTLISEMASLSGKNVVTGGNLGTPALDLLSDTPPDFYILELSSFQLETVSSLNAFASVVLNLSADHLDRYDSIHDYQQAKARIYNGDGVMVINRDDPIVQQMMQPDRNVIGFSLQQTAGVDFGLIEQDETLWLAEGQTPLMPVNELGIAGRHNIANALAALALGSAMALPIDAMLQCLKSFKGLAHRCRLVRVQNDVRWFNDSKATNVGACIAAIEGLAEDGNVVLIAGGMAKDQDFSPLTEVFTQSLRALVLFGVDAAKIAAVTPASVAIHYAANMQDAVEKAASVAHQGDVVLLSPACASFDMFKGYEDRGTQFEQAVRELA
ncbi:UDP-N-acetylmuramoyl-L-alanine--D-glutamate ligase [Methylophaga lonarensis]|uniref:UDP-N-acetylmuramoyl-L-alanine--D-glutamate ligase n=1 Tax=Methylophaga lonarensis TaxID=999151 RepID=UPI003D26BD69